MNVRSIIHRLIPFAGCLWAATILQAEEPDNLAELESLAAELRQERYDLGSKDQELIPNPERLRSGWGTVYQESAAGVVLVRARDGYGSGFVIEGGLIVTNHDVAKTVIN